MQNAIAPIAPTTPTTPIESKPSPRAPASHAFATLLRQNQSPAPAKATPVKPTKSEGAVDAEASSPLETAQNGAAHSVDARRASDAQDARSDADRVDAAREDKTAKDSADATTRDDRERAASTDASGTGVPFTHGLVALHRLATAPAESAASDKAARTGRVSAAGVGGAAEADGESTSTSATANPWGNPLAPRSPPIDGRQDGPSSPVRPGTGDGDKIAFALAETPPAVTTPIAPSALRTEATMPAQAAAPSEAAQASGGAPVDATVDAPFASPDFAQAFAVQVSVLVQDGVQSAELHLNPVETGPVSVQITVDGTQARIDFGADALATRQAIEAGLPELASALRDAGMTLQGGGVSQHARDPNGDSRSGGAVAQAGALRGDDDARTAPVVRQRTVVAGGVDLYA